MEHKERTSPDIFGEPSAGITPELTRVCIIIPSTCEERRYQSLCRAIDSILQQTDVSPRVLLIVNGTRFAPARLKTLQERRDIEVVYEQVGSSVNAIGIGRTLVQEPFFGFLDDDDEYLPNALAHRLRPLLNDHDIDFVASNGLRQVSPDLDEQFLVNTSQIEAHPLEQLLQENWLASCGGLFRTSSVLARDFDPSIRYFEWTYLAFLLASSRRMAFVDVPTFRIHSTPESLSKSAAYQNSETIVLQRILELPLPESITNLLKVKLGAAHHDAAEWARITKQWRLAWHHHLRSLGLPGGMRYLAYTRHLLLKP